MKQIKAMLDVRAGGKGDPTGVCHVSASHEGTEGVRVGIDEQECSAAALH
jgi:hypothetical protein